MTTNGTSEVIRYLRRTALQTETAGATDGQLLATFIDRRDVTALEALVQRHGPMVWGVCRRLLPGHHDAEDAFQATFLVLVRRAASVSPREMVANWLYGVARQTALKARTVAARRRLRESHIAPMPEPPAPEQEPPDNDLRRLFDEELSHLPHAYRVAVVLCDLEGMSRKDAAGQLGLPEGTVASRVARGRQILARRLAKRGLATVAVAALGQQLATACPPAVISSVVKAVGPAAGLAAPVSAEVAALAEGVMKSMLLNKLKGLTVALALTLAGALTLAWGWQAHSQPPPAPQQGKGNEKDKPKPEPQTPKEPSLRSTIETPNGQVKSLTFSPDGKTLASTLSEGRTWSVTTWDVETGKGHRLQEHGPAIYSLSYSTDGKTLAWVCDDRAIKIWNFAAARETHNLTERGATSLVYSPDGKELASTHNDGTVRARDLATGKEWILQQHGNRVFSLTYSADGKTVAWGCEDGSVRVWSGTAGKETCQVKDGDREVSIVRLSPDGMALAAAGRWGDSVRLLDATTGKEVSVFKVDRDLVTCLAFSPDGKTLAAAGNKGLVQLWDVATGKKLADLKGHESVSSLAFSPDGKTLASGGKDKAIRLWDIPAR